MRGGGGNKYSIYKILKHLTIHRCKMPVLNIYQWKVTLANGEIKKYKTKDEITTDLKISRSSIYNIQKNKHRGKTSFSLFNDWTIESIREKIPKEITTA